LRCTGTGEEKKRKGLRSEADVCERKILLCAMSVLAGFASEIAG
jgi:hypothetical protein